MCINAFLVCVLLSLLDSKDWTTGSLNDSDLYYMIEGKEKFEMYTLVI